MIRKRSIVRVASGPVITAGVLAGGVLAGSPAAAFTEQGTFVDLTRALQGLSDVGGRTTTVSAPVESFTHDLALAGVVITGERRLAVIQRGAGSELLPVGQSAGGYRLIDVEESQATLEGPRGERIVLRLPAGGAAGAPATAAGASPAASSPPVSPSPAAVAEAIKAKEARTAERAERAAREKSRALAERGIFLAPKD